MEMRDVDGLNRVWRRYPPPAVGIHHVYRALLAMSGADDAATYVDATPISAPVAGTAPVTAGDIESIKANVIQAVFGGR